MTPPRTRAFVPILHSQDGFATSMVSGTWAGRVDAEAELTSVQRGA